MTIEALGKAEDQAAWVPTDETFAARLALVRWRMGWNIKEAALACGVPTASWRLWELEHAQPRRLIEVATLISKRTGCDFGWLLAGSRLRERPATLRELASRSPQARPPDRRPSGHPGIIRTARTADPLAA